MGIKKEGWLIGLLLIVALVISFLFDYQIIKFIVELRNPILDYLFLGIAFTSSLIIVFLFLTTIFLYDKKKRRWILPLWLSVLLSVLISFVIKIIIHRPRPFQVRVVSALRFLAYEIINTFDKWNFAFPSFHAVLVFAAVPIINKEFRKFRHVWMVFACLVAFSRIYFGMHYLSDVIAGGIIGYFIGYIMVLIEEKYKLGFKIINKINLG